MEFFRGTLGTVNERARFLNRPGTHNPRSGTASACRVFSTGTQRHCETSETDPHSAGSRRAALGSLAQASADGIRRPRRGYPSKPRVATEGRALWENHLRENEP